MRGKWAEGIAPRNFAWVIKDGLAVSERPGGFSRNHRPVRRKEEIIWLRVQGFNRVVSLLVSPHNLHVYEKEGLPSVHIPLLAVGDPSGALGGLYGSLDDWLGQKEKVLVHQEEMSDQVMGVAAGYLLWSKRTESGPQAIMAIERIIRRQMGPPGRELVAVTMDLRRPGDR
ncbi:MAG: hypothetical protein M0020_09315 [Actinomycetota bacterium]|nr:hypothetical protein [Actinomycetota bacterium]